MPTRTPIYQLEPANLLEPLNLSDRDGTAEVSSVAFDDGPPVPPARRPIRSAPAAPRSGHGSGHPVRNASLILLGALACMAAGATMPGLAMKVLTKLPVMAESTAGKTNDVGQAPAKASEGQTTPSQNETAVADPKRAAAPATAASTANDSVPGPVPCNQQTWPYYNRDCLKGPTTNSPATAADAPPVRTVTPNVNSNGSSRTNQTVGQAVSPQPTGALRSEPAAKDSRQRSSRTSPSTSTESGRQASQRDAANQASAAATDDEDPASARAERSDGRKSSRRPSRDAEYGRGYDNRSNDNRDYRESRDRRDYRGGTLFDIFPRFGPGW